MLLVAKAAGVGVTGSASSEQVGGLSGGRGGKGRVYGLGFRV